MQKSRTFVLISLGVLVFIGALSGYVLREVPEVPIPQQAGATREEQTSGIASKRMTDPVGARRVVDSGAAEAYALESLYREASDYLSFLSEVSLKADEGDPQAQYYAASAIAYCRSLYGFYFIRGEKHRTLDEGLQWASTRVGVDAEEARQVHARCAALMRNGSQWFDRAAGWIESSADSGCAPALVQRASGTLRLVMTGVAVAGEQNAAAKAAHVERERAAADLRAALAQKHPAALWAVGDFQILLGASDTNAQVDQWVWKLAACKSGYDCGDTSEAYRFLCRFDTACQPGESIDDIARRILGNRYLDAAERADELAHRVASGEIVSLELVR